ncbi:PLD nuclease N-terminal domain-containing protein [Tersicoccus sp. MR15.9]|uniref:PLD nuclease N-terminal domain-containing protein n=1 Tax=Tersicoccus mangrovi TaxID=3121635 RepID=UPI002FE619BD
MRYLPFAVLAIAMIYTLVDCVRSDGGHVRAMPKAAWFLVILILPVVGIVLWFLFGRPQTVTASAPISRPLAPDDDPRFLSDLAERRRRERAAQQAAERAAQQRAAQQSAAEPTQTPDADRPVDDTVRDQHPDRNGRNPAQGSAGTGPDEITGS